MAEKRILLISLISLLLVLILLPFAAYGKEERSGFPSASANQMKGSPAPVGQPLVPEGVFALKLAEILKIGQAEDEAQAENMLSSAGIKPKTGWIAAYPVTPVSLDEIRRAVAEAANAGKLRMGKEEALERLDNFQEDLGLSIAPGSAQSILQPEPAGVAGETVIYKYVDRNGVVNFTDRYETIPREYRDNLGKTRVMVRSEPSGEPAAEESEREEEKPSSAPPSEAVNRYYDDEGPPVVTYYPPPEPYAPLYAWVPHPFRGWGFSFRGFFILHDFHRHVFFKKRPFVVTNQVNLIAEKKVLVVDPVHRTLTGGKAVSPLVFKSPGVQSGARTIDARSRSRIASVRGSVAPGVAKTASSSPVGRIQGQFFPNRETPRAAGVARSRDDRGSPRTEGLNPSSIPQHGENFRTPSGGGGNSLGGVNRGGNSGFMGRGRGSSRGNSGGRH